VSEGASTVQRLRTAAVCSILTGLVFLQEPGLIVTDTKLDLTVDPVGWLQRALHLWEPHGWLGQVQNQAYGYLFPMGPFFALGHLLGLPAWVVQRSWTALLMCVALVGVQKVAQRLGIGTSGTQLAAGVVYVLSPRFLTTVGPISAETLPMALAPWILLPLIARPDVSRLRSAVARSGLAVFACGAVNAVATLAVLPVPLLYLLTRERGRLRARWLAAWGVAVAAACAWWVVPLVLLGSVSPPFLDWIESAQVTTLPTALVETLRGTSDWVAFSASVDGPFWRGGWLLVTNPVSILDTVVIAGLGFYGLARRDLPERRFLTFCALVGVVAVTFGHVGPASPSWAGWAQGLLDGVLAPFRNVHKFDPVLRLPLVLATAHALAVLGRRVRRPDAPALPAMSAALAGLVLLGAASPLVTGELAPRGAFDAVPAYWGEAAAWLDARDDGAAVVVPAASFGTYYWGDPRDEPLQPLAGSAWVVRDAVPLTPAGTIRLLDAIDSRLAIGEGGPGLSTLLSRAGLRYVVVRNDLDYARAGTTRPVLVHQALAATSGVAKVASFGGVVGGGSRPGLRVDAGLDLPYRAVEIFEVQGAAPRVSAAPLSSALVVSGGPEDLGELGDAGVPLAGPVLLEGDLPEGWAAEHPGLEGIRTDGYRRRETDFGLVGDNTSATLSASDQLALNNPARDYLPFGDGYATSAVPLGGSVEASTSMSDAGNIGGTRPERQPFAAVDGDLATSWSSASGEGALGQWISLDAGHVISAAAARIVVQPDVFGVFPTRLRVTEQGGSVEVPVSGPATWVSIPILPGGTQSVRVEPVAMSDGGRGVSFVVSELELPGAAPQRPLALPSPDLAADRVVLSAGRGRDGCVQVGRRPLCAEGLERSDEDDLGIDRLINGASGSWELSGFAVPKPGPALSALLARTDGLGVHATASSAAVQDPRGDPQRVTDGNIETGWTAASGDQTPTVTLQWGEERLVSGISVTIDPALAASAPTSVRVVGDDGSSRTAPLGSDNVAWFVDGLRTTSLTVTFPGIHPEGTFDPYTGRTDLLPVGVSELVPVGVGDLVGRDNPAQVITSPCGSGPELTVGGRVTQTSVTGERASIERLEPQRWEACNGSTVSLVPDSRVSLKAAPAWRAGSLTLIRSGTTDAGGAISPPVPVQVLQDGSDTRTVAVAARPEPVILSVLENVNAGWLATSAGERLEPVTVDGWHQGWVVPAGAATTVRLEFAPQSRYRLALCGGAGLVVGLLVAAVLPVRRRRLPDLRPGRGGGVDLVVFAVALAWLGGVVGGVLAVVAWWLRQRVKPRRSRRREWAAVIAALALLTAGLAFVARPWSSTEGYAGDLAWPQWLCLLVLALALVPTSADEAPEGLAGALDDDPAEPGRQEAGGQRDSEDEPEVARERLDVQRAEDDVEDQDVPEEQPVRDAP
jgi:arabinofuranan 3-O-arabinosyltransferase